MTIVDALEARDTVPDLSSISPDLQPVFARMLAPNPEERFRSMDEVIAALDAPAASFAAASPFDGGPAAAPSAATTPPAFIRATTTPPPVAASRSRLPLYAGIAAAVLVVAGGGGYALLGGKGATPVPPVSGAAAADAAVASGTATASAARGRTDTAVDRAGAPSAVPAATAGGDWAAVRPQVLAALGGMPCSDLRVAGTPSGGVVHLAGWRPDGTALPAGPAGWTFDPSGTAAVAAPSPATCAVVDAIRAAVPATATGFNMPGEQRVALATARKDAAGAPLVDLKPAGQPAGLPHTLITMIDDHARSARGRVLSVDVAASKLDLSALAFDAKPGRNLAVLVASGSSLPSVTASGAPGLAAACGSACALTSGWIEVR